MCKVLSNENERSKKSYLDFSWLRLRSPLPPSPASATPCLLLHHHGHGHLLVLLLLVLVGGASEPLPGLLLLLAVVATVVAGRLRGLLLLWVLVESAGASEVGREAIGRLRGLSRAASEADAVVLGVAGAPAGHVAHAAAAVAKGEGERGNTR